MNKIYMSLRYSDVNIVPNRKCIVNSRSECSTAFTLGKHTFSLPVFAANMKAVVDEATCHFFSELGLFYIMHRFNVDNVSFIKSMQRTGNITSISMGVNEDSYTELMELKREHLVPDYITIDIANAWSPKGFEMIKYIKDNFWSFLIVGNVGCAEAVLELEEAGADCVKVGIAGGRVCITKNKTGFHSPMVSTVLECSKVAKKPIIADGGIVEHGDIAKALVCGATGVMAGSLFAGYDQSAGDKVEISGRTYKEYYGSASEANKGHNKHIEGKKILVDYKGDMKPLIDELTDDLRSSVSYAGGKDLSIFSTCDLSINSGT